MFGKRSLTASLDPILSSSIAVTTSTVIANARNRQSMGSHAKSMLSAHFIPQANEFIALKFDELLTMDAMQMVVRRIPVVVLVYGPTIQFKTAE